MGTKERTSRGGRRGAALGVAAGLAILLPGPAAANHLTVPTDCQIDIQGANDEPGQKDLTTFCAAFGTGAFELFTKWNSDNVFVFGGSTNDACSLYDTDNDGLANLVVCVTTRDGGNPASLGAFRLFTCADTRPDRCVSSTMLAGHVCSGGDNAGAPCTSAADCFGGGICTPGSGKNTSCEVSQAADDPFSAGDDYPIDTQAVCGVDLGDFGAVGSSARLIDACSYPSDIPNSDPSDCIVFAGCTLDSECNDGNACTNDICDLSAGEPGFCVHTVTTVSACGSPADTVCDDPDTCNSLGFCQPNFEPSTVECRPSGASCDPAENCTGSSATCPLDTVNRNAQLGFTVRAAKTPTNTTISWTESEPGPFNIYRGSRLAVPFSYNHACFLQDEVGPSVTDTDTPSAGTLFYYLVSRVQPPCDESSLGDDSEDVERPNSNPCPSLGLDSDMDGGID